MGKNSFLVLGFCFFCFSAFADGHKYVVFFKDKANSSYSINEPEEFLSERSVSRKEKFNIPVTEEDIPVNHNYLSQLKTFDLEVLFSSRWLNAALVEANEEVVDEVNDLDFVRSVDFVAPEEEKNGRRNRHRVQPATRGVSTSLSSGGVNFNQNRMLGVNEMHKKGYTGEGLLIAIFDSGFLTVDESSFFSHVYENDGIRFTRDFVNGSGNVFQYDTHGTRSLSTMAAQNEGEYTGIAYDADFVLCVTEDVSREYKIEEYYWLLAAELADSLGADIISSSLAYSTFDDASMNYEYEDMDGNTTVITKAAEMAARRGIIVVTSAGNDGNKPWRYINAPADGDSVLAIGAVDMSLSRASFSSFGPTADGRIKPDLCALGSQVKVVTGENIFSANGTSFSTPLVGGLAAGLWQAFPDLSSFELVELLKSTASNSADPDTVTGYGVPNFIDAFNKAYDVDNTEETFIVYPNPVDGSKILVASSGFLDIGKVKVNFADFKGASVKKMEIQVYNKSETLEIDVSDLRQGYYLTKFTAGDKEKIVKLIVL